MRVFVAIDIPEQVRAELEALQSELTIGRSVPSDNLHLTLCFLGEQPEQAVEEAHLALSVLRAAAFDLQLAGVGSFGNRAPRVIFADVARNADLAALEQRIARSLRRAGLQFEKRRFRPHVTIARLPRAVPPSELAMARDFLADHAAFKGSPFRVADFRLYRSVLTPRAALHDTLACYRLAEF
ncbi:RNA 2',3'-cyclic phosphodiesterase [Sedimentitalea sp. JM2-8]|uniref:RNA 2',3'-cyclic phosphodiesterase n=1 Tax=Sedimentitalea xiamensis TaxID=3050037 RepID=A0ABT7FEY6_9RHOB|nr:RNA 2',3'-cyclic phosphodiesterase [Sedimentitalea xiamensis]MDK3073691.1 RNA 2',3'-cyclic phosphodiesterase [Sedimentitalea xiamensis]